MDAPIAGFLESPVWKPHVPTREERVMDRFRSLDEEGIIVQRADVGRKGNLQSRYDLVSTTLSRRTGVDIIVSKRVIEQDRLDLQHHLMTMTLDGKLCLAPIEDIPGGLHDVLDICTGTGIWAVDFASQYPTANVVGSDLSPIQPEYVPPNCSFEIDDVEAEWIYNHKFDFIHGRMLATCFRSHKTVFESAFDALRPGGYFEMQDVIMPVRCVDSTGDGSALLRWNALLVEGAKALGKNWCNVVNYKSYFEQAGFVDIVEKQLAWPIGDWPRSRRMKRIGRWCLEDFHSGMEALSLAVLTRGLGWSSEEVSALLSDIRDELKAKIVHAYAPIIVIYGRKPV